MAIFKKKTTTEASSTSTSDENAKMLPDDKKSKSEITTKNTNAILLFIAFVMLGIFVIGAIFTANKNQTNIDAIDQSTAKQTTTTTTTLTETFTYISPIVSSDPQTVKLENIIIGNETFNSIMISVANNPIKINDISFSTQVDGLSFDDDCTQRESITPEAGCIINLVWTPTKIENKNIFMILTYNDPDANSEPNQQTERGKVRTFKINISLSSIEKTEPVSQTYEEEEYDDFYDEDDEEYEEEEEDFQPATKGDVKEFTDATAPAISQSTQKRTVYPDDCKKYASKAYDFSGTFIGWVQTNNDVFSPNCSKVVGVLQEDGMVLETGTGKLIGKGAVFDKKKSEEKRIELTLPILNEVMETINSENFNPNFEDVWNNRLILKRGDYNERKESTEDYDIYKADDPLNIISKQANSLIPFTITDISQVSSMPKDERYILRQSKPIPAVLNRPIYFDSSTNQNSRIDESGMVIYEGTGNAIATVERNVYGGDGRTIIIPAGSQLIGTAEPPAGAGLQEIEKINITWSRLIRPDGAEFDLNGLTAYTGDAQGRAGVPGKNDTEYMRDLFIKPLLYSAIPVAMEALFPTSSQFVTRAKRSDGTYQALDTFLNDDGENEVGLVAEDSTYGWDPSDTQTIANMSSKDKMKLEIEQNWKTTMQKLVEQSAQQAIPFTIAAGTRIMIFLNNDIMLRIEDNMEELLQDANEYKYSNE